MISCVNRFVYKVNANDAADASGEILVNHFLLCVEELMEISKGNKNFMCHVLLALPSAHILCRAGSVEWCSVHLSQHGPYQLLLQVCCYWPDWQEILQQWWANVGSATLSASLGS